MQGKYNIKDMFINCFGPIMGPLGEQTCKLQHLFGRKFRHHHFKLAVQSNLSEANTQHLLQLLSSLLHLQRQEESVYSNQKQSTETIKH